MVSSFFSATSLVRLQVLHGTFLSLDHTLARLWIAQELEDAGPSYLYRKKFVRGHGSFGGGMEMRDEMYENLTRTRSHKWET